MKTGNDVTSINDLNQSNSFHVKRTVEVSVSSNLEANVGAAETQLPTVVEVAASFIGGTYTAADVEIIEVQTEVNVGIVKRAFEAPVTDDLEVERENAGAEVVTEATTTLDRDSAAVSASRTENVKILGFEADRKLLTEANVGIANGIVKPDLESIVAAEIAAKVDSLRAKQDVVAKINIHRIGLTPVSVPLMIRPSIVPEFARKSRNLLTIAKQKMAELAPISTLGKSVPKALATAASTNEVVGEVSETLLQVAWDGVRRQVTQHPYYFVAATAAATVAAAGVCYYFCQKRQINRRTPPFENLETVTVDQSQQRCMWN